MVVDARFLTKSERILGSIAIVVAVVAAWRVSAPTIRPDEWGYLLNGQVLLGRHEPLLPYARYYGPVYGLVTAAGSVVTGSLSGAFRFALFVNVILMASTGLATARLARRWGVGERLAALCGLVLMVAPGTMATSLYSWAEPMVRLLVILVVVLAMDFETDGRGRALGAFIVLSGVAPLLHGRLVVLTLSSLMLVVLWWRAGRIPTRRFAVGVLSILLLYVSGRSFAFMLRRWLYRNRMTQESRLVALLTDPHHLTDLVREMAGQGWYLLASTAAVGAVGLTVSLVRGRRALGREQRAGDRVALFVAVLSLLTLFMGSLQLVEATRGDQFVYGRYVETVVPVLFVVGISSLADAGRSRSRSWNIGIMGVLVVPVALVLVLRQDIVSQWVRLNGALRSPNIPALDGMQALIRGAGLVRFAVAFTVVSGVVMWVSRRSLVTALRLMAALFLVSSSWTALRTMDVRSEKWQGLGSTFATVREAGSATIGYDDSTPADKAYYVLRYRLHPVRLEWMRVSGPDAVVPAVVNCVYGYPDRTPTGGGWEIAGTEESIARVLWRRTTAARC